MSAAELDPRHRARRSADPRPVPALRAAADLGRRRNQVGLAALAAVPVILAVAMKVSAPAARRTTRPGLLRPITGNGFFVALAA